MIIVKPYAAEIDPQNHYTTRLHFDNGVVKRFYCRGSIAWPEGQKEGFALMAGYDLQAQTVIIFEQFPFWTVKHWFNDDGTIRIREDGTGYYMGLNQFISDNLSKYRCSSYFWGGQHVDIWRRFGREVYQHPETPRRIEMIEVPFVAENGPGILEEKIKTRRFKGQTGSQLEKSVTQFTAMNDGHCGNPALSLMTLLAGMEFQPWINLERNAA